MTHDDLVKQVADVLASAKSDRLTTKEIAVAIVGPLHATRYRGRISSLGRHHCDQVSKIVEERCGRKVAYVHGDWSVRRDTRVPPDPLRQAAAQLAAGIIKHRLRVPPELLSLSLDVERALGSK